MCGSTISVSACVISSQKQSVYSWSAVAVTSGEHSVFPNMQGKAGNRTVVPERPKRWLCVL